MKIKLNKLTENRYCKKETNANKLLQSDLFLCPTWWKSDAKDVVFTMISNISIIQRYLRKLIAMLWDETAFQDLIIFFRYKPVMHVDSIFVKCFYGPSNFVSKYFQNSAEPGVKTRCPSVPAAHYHPKISEEPPHLPPPPAGNPKRVDEMSTAGTVH